jgi:hypothetical protein
MNGGGTATSTPPGISCPPACGAPFDGSAPVTLTLASDDLWEFDSWDGCDQPDGATCTMTVDRDKNLTVNLYQMKVSTVVLPGTLTLPAGLSPANFLVGNRLGSATPDASGHFSIPVLASGVTITAAAPKGQPDGDAVWLTTTLMSPDQPSATLVAIDANSTAKGILALFPTFLTPDPFSAKLLLDAMGTMPEVQLLTDQVVKKFPMQLHPLDDADFRNAYAAALEAVAGAIPDSVPPAAAPPRAVARELTEALQGAGRRVQMHRMDHISQVEFKAVSDTLLKAETSRGNPLDTYIVLWQVDPFAVHSLMAGAKEVGSFRMNSVDDALKRDNEPDRLNPRFPEFLRLGPRSKASYAIVPAASLFKYLDVFEDLTTLVKELLHLSNDREKLALLSQDDAVYIIRAFNGRFDSGADKGEWDFVWQNYQSEAISAVKLNVLAASIDAISLVVDIKKLFAPHHLEECLAPIVFDVGNKATQSLSNAAISDGSPEVVQPLLLDVGKTAVKKLLDCSLKVLTKSPHKLAVRWGELVLSFVNIPKKISKIGSLYERIWALSGSKTGLTPIPAFMTPLDSVVVVVGNPFSPTIQTVNGVDASNAPNPLPCVKNGEPLVITGTGFIRQTTDPNPGLFITDQTLAQVQIKKCESSPKAGCYTISASTGTPVVHTIRTQVPDELTGKLQITLVQYNQTNTRPVLEVCPSVVAIRPGNYFRTDPHERHRIVRLEGKGFLKSRDAWVLGTDAYTPDSGDINHLEFTALPSSIAAGNQEVKIRFRAGTAPAAGTPPVYFRVLGPAAIDSITEAAGAYVGQPLHIVGRNFGENTEDVTVIMESDYSSVPAQKQVSTVAPTLIIFNQDQKDDQTAYLSPPMGLQYFDPSPPNNAPMPARAKIRTPEGDSPFFNFRVLPGLPPFAGPYTRYLNVPWITLAQAFHYANQTEIGVSTAPDGTVAQSVICTSGFFCCVTFPTSYVPVPDPNHPQCHARAAGVSAPPGLQVATGTCGTCSGSLGPDSWVGIPPEKIDDTIQIDTSSSGGAGGTIRLSELTPSDALRGPKVTLLLNPPISPPPTNAWVVTGGGLVIDQTTDGRFGRGGAPQQIAAYLNVTNATGTVVTVKNARGIILSVSIFGAPARACDIGVRIENSADVRVTGEIQDCKQAVFAKDSEGITLELQASGYQDAGITLNGTNSSTVSSQIGYRQITTGLLIPPGQQTGILLNGGSAGNTIRAFNLVGNVNGVWLQDSSRNFVVPGGVGMFFAGQIADSAGTPTGNQVGVRLSNGANDNVLTTGGGPLYGSRCPAIPNSGGSTRTDGFLVLNDIGILIEGGAGNQVCGLYLGASPRALAASPLGNRIGLKMQAAAASQPLDNRITLNHFTGNRQYGVEIDGATRANLFISNYFGNALSTRPVTGGDPPNGVCGVHVTNLSKAVRFSENLIWEEIIGVCLDNSDAVQFKANAIHKSQTIGVKMESSRDVSFDGDRICGDINCANLAKAGQKGMHIIASSGYRLTGVLVSGIGGNGIEIEKAPLAPIGLTVLSGEVDTGTLEAPPERIDFLAPIFTPPLFFRAGNRLLSVGANAGKGIYIHDGARDITISDATVLTNGGNGIELSSTGDNIRIEGTRIGGLNAGDGIHVEWNTGANVFIGRAKNGNWIENNGGWGVQIIHSEHVTVQDNHIGINIGDNPLLWSPSPNALGGIAVVQSDDILIGGNDPNAGNIVSGNSGDGILVQDFNQYPSPPILIEGNFIGTADDGQAWRGGSVGNFGYGIDLVGTPPKPNAAIVIADNLVAGNGGGGIRSQEWGSAKGPRIEGNVVGQWGLDGSRTSPPNSGPGISFSNSDKGIVRLNRIGTNQGKLGRGMDFTSSSGNRVSRNTVKNQTLEGIVLSNGSNDNSILFNIVATNALFGVSVVNASVRNAIQRNSMVAPDGSIQGITANGGKGISLQTGGNREIPPPVIRSSGQAADGTYSFAGDVRLGVPDGSTVEIFMDEASQGRVYLASVGTVGHTFEFVGVPVPPGETFAGKQFNATVTDPNNNTSEFGASEYLSRLTTMVASNEGNNIALWNIASKSGSVIISNPAQNPSVCENASGKFVAFASSRDGRMQIYLTSSSGNPITRLTNDTADDIEPNFSADCSKISFASNRDGNYEIYAMSRDGTGQTRLTNNPGQDRQPDWSPDGAKIVFSSDRGGSFQIYTMNATDGSNLQALPASAGWNRNPAWKKIPNLIAFENCSGAAPSYEPCSSVVYDTNTGGLTPVTTPDRIDQHPTWYVADDGTHYLIVSSRAAGSAGPFHLYLTSAGGFLISQITPAAKDDREPSCCVAP